MSSVVIQGDTSGSVTIQAPTVSGTTIINLPTVTGGSFIVGDSGNNVSLSSNLTFTGTGNRITGDFSNATVASRVAFQTNLTNAGTRVGALPNGTSLNSSYDAYNNPDPTNAAYGRFGVTGATEVTIQSAISGTGTYLPMTFYTGGSERMRIDSSGNVGIGVTSTSGYKFAVGGTGLKNQFIASDANNAYLYTDGSSYIGTTGAFNNVFVTNNTERMRIDALGNVMIGYTTTTSNNNSSLLVAGNIGVGTNAPVAKLDIAANALAAAVAVNTNSNGNLPAVSNGLVISQNYTGGTAGAAEIDFFYNSSTYLGDNGGFRFYQRTGATTVNEMMRMTQNAVITYTGGTERMRIDSIGYVTNAVNGNGNGLHQAYQYYRLNTTFGGTNVATAQPMFPVSVTLAGSTVYEFEIVMQLIKTAGSTAHNIGIGYGGTATINNFVAQHIGALHTATDYSGTAAPFFHGLHQTVTNTGVSGGTGASVTLYFWITIKGTVSINAGGTFIPQYTCTAAPGGAYSTQIGSYFKIAAVSAAGANTAIGTWA